MRNRLKGEASLVCHYCGAINPNDTIFCGTCGKRVETQHHNASTLLSPLSDPTAKLTISSYFSNHEKQSSLAPQKHNGRGHWIMLGIMTTLLLLLVIWGIFVYVNRSTPTKTLETLCDALLKHDFLTAYDQFTSTSYVKQETEQQYASSVQQYNGIHGDTVNCSVSDVNESGSSASGVLTFTYGNGSSMRDSETLTVENGVWKISRAAPI